MCNCDDMINKLKTSSGVRLSIWYKRDLKGGECLRHHFIGKVLKVRKKSVLFRVNEEKTITIGFRVILSCHDIGFRSILKYKLIYNSK